MAKFNIQMAEPYHDHNSCSSCPFHPLTMVKPFSNSTEFDVWTGLNCEVCENMTYCDYRNDLDTAAADTGRITLATAKAIGCKYNALYGTIQLHSVCRKFHDADRPF